MPSDLAQLHARPPKLLQVQQNKVLHRYPSMPVWHSRRCRSAPGAEGVTGRDGKPGNQGGAEAQGGDQFFMQPVIARRARGPVARSRPPVRLSRHPIPRRLRPPHPQHRDPARAKTRRCRGGPPLCREACGTRPDNRNISYYFGQNALPLCQALYSDADRKGFQFRFRRCGCVLSIGPFATASRTNLSFLRTLGAMTKG